ncbi:MAG: hypothetical protein HWN79_07450 [Candidatus Lokiarchaeota archaeon]|nr:hypothetical protein [Candidatus Lokiarchaeota archaeon]
MTIINDYFKENWLKILKINSKINLVEEPKQLKESVRIPLTPIEIDAFLLYHIFELLYPRFVNDQQNILDIIVSDFELENIVFGIYLYETTKPGIHSAIKKLPKDSIEVKQEELGDKVKLFNRLQAFFLKEHGIKISCMRIIRKRGVDLINSHCEKLNKLNTSDFFISLLDLIQISLKNDLFSIQPEPNFLRFFKECISFLNGLQLSKLFTFFDSLLPSFNTLLIMNSARLPIALKLKKENNKTLNSEIDIKLTLLESEKYNLNTKTNKAGLSLIQSDFNVEKIVNFNQNPFLLFLSELFEAKIPPNKEIFKLLFQKVLYGIRSYDLNWSMFPKPKINNFLFRFLIRLFGININLKKLSHWAIPDFLFDLGAMFIGLNAKILLVLTDKNKNNSKQTPTELLLFNFENGVINNLEYIKDQDIITEMDQQSLESVRLIISEQYGFISNVLMVDKYLIKKIIEDFIIDSHKISIFSLLKIFKLLKNPQYFQLNPEIPPYTLLKKKGSISFLKDLLSIVVDKHEF